MFHTLAILCQGFVLGSGAKGRIPEFGECGRAANARKAQTSIRKKYNSSVAHHQSGVIATSPALYLQNI